MKIAWYRSPSGTRCYLKFSTKLSYFSFYMILNIVSIISQIIMAVFLENKLCNNISIGPMCISIILLAAKELFAVKFAGEGVMCPITPYSRKKSAAIVKVI